ncbi:MAG: AraC family transcriptional regulator [Paenibacillaceae bacterium]|nr:AraC family transcriptional regulator [Paenibacillaceae bacterium]
MFEKKWLFFSSKSKSVRKKILIVASLLAMIPVFIMGAAAYYIASGSFVEEINLANRQTISQIQQRIDEKLVTLETVALQNAVNPTLSRFLSLNDPENDLENIGLTMSLLNSMQVLIADIDSVYLYRPDKRLVVSPSIGVRGEELLPDHVREAISKNPAKIWLDHELENELVRDGFHRITFVRRINASDHSPAGYLIVNLNDTAFFRVFTNMRLGNRELLIVTPSGNVFAENTRNQQRDVFKEYGFIRKLMESDESEMMTREEVNGQELSVNYLKSSYNGWKYVTIIPLSELNRHLDKIRDTTFIICLVLVLISAIAAGFLSNGWFKALQSVIDTIRKKGGITEPLKQQNEFALIRNYFESLYENNEMLGKQIEESRPVLQVNFIQKLLTEHFGETMADRAKYYHIPMKYAHYTVICIELDNMRGHTEQDLNLFHYAVMNISKEMISRYSEGLVVRMHSGHIAILINHEGVESFLTDDKSKPFHIAEEIRQVAESLLKITVTMGIGRNYEGLSQIRNSYREALEALEYQMVEGSGRVLFIGQINPGSTSFSYPYEIEQNIITHLKMANLQQINGLLDEFTQELRAELFSTEHVRQSFAQLIAVTLRTLFEMDPTSTLFREYNLYQHLNELSTSEKIVNWLKTEVYPPIVEQLRNRTVQRNHSTIQKVLNHIHEYYDTDLSLPLLAAIISVPVSQFSHMFKADAGMTPSEYVIAYRMEKARAMLEETDSKVSEIAEKLQYNNSQNFIRVFKKMNGMTPGEYRSRSKE